MGPTNGLMMDSSRTHRPPEFRRICAALALYEECSMKSSSLLSIPSIPFPSLLPVSGRIFFDFVESCGRPEPYMRAHVVVNYCIWHGACVRNTHYTHL